MSEEEKEIVNETKQLLENLTGLDISERFNNKYTGFNFLINSRNVDILIKVIEKQQNRIDELEKALIEEQLKHRDKINKTIKYIEEETCIDYEREICHEMYEGQIFELIKILEE